ncbi:hypothetical protein G7054_g3725 [Neopestalotiopsis clavispora]|nr:hypothetical protein G7054_g3725 [Neopestalotiopsis clavispora]
MTESGAIRPSHHHNSRPITSLPFKPQGTKTLKGIYDSRPHFSKTIPSSNHELTVNSPSVITTTIIMASRRIVSTEKSILEKDDSIGASPAASEKSNISPAVPADVIIKLLAFTLAMIVVPIGSYYATVNTLFKGNSTFAGALAAIMANVVLVAYVIVAYNEDQSEQLEEKKKDTKKQR